MFMMDMQGTRDFATLSSSSRTPGERYCGSCIARPIRSNADGFTSAGPAAETLPGNLRESISTGSLRPRTGIRTRKPSALIRSASAGRQTSVTLWPANIIFDASSDP